MTLGSPMGRARIIAVPIEVPKEALLKEGFSEEDVESNLTLFESNPDGCEKCNSGYKGRVSIHELLTCDSATQRLMVESPSRDQLNEHMLAQGVTTLREAGIQRALEGRTTLEEAARVVNA